MPMRADPFLDALRQLSFPSVNPLPMFGKQFGQETVFNSSPYVLSYTDFRAVYGNDQHRLALIDALEGKLKFAGTLGLIIDLVLIGGSFLRLEETPRDIDGLGFYHIQDCVNVETVIEKFENNDHHLSCDLKICPVDCGATVIVKRAIFFSNIFSYDKKDEILKFGTLLVDTHSLMPDGDL